MSDSQPTEQPSEPQPVSEPEAQLTERLLPQTSIRTLFLAIGLCSLGMYTFRQAIVADALWAQCLSAVLGVGIACFAAYIAVFLAINLYLWLIDLVVTSIGIKRVEKTT